MSKPQGTIVLMGSGEMTATMVEVHKKLLKRSGKTPRAVFLDTPAGFQLNADDIAQKAMSYFSTRVQHTIEVASFKSARSECEAATQQAFGLLRQADYILIGPGSPTYALKQWQQSPVPQIIIQRIESGGCLVAASAAALTVGAQTLPVYEIYKVGLAEHWVTGLNLLGHFGLNLVVIPHWNNAEGGNHDTRYCFMGAPRLAKLESILPEPIPLLGLDEHTALIIDLGRRQVDIEGAGYVTVRYKGHEYRYGRGDELPLALLQGKFPKEPAATEKGETTADAALTTPPAPDDIWDTIHALAKNTKAALEHHRDEQVAGHLLSLERHIWRSQRYLDERNELGAARQVLREIIALLISKMASRPASTRACQAPVVEAVLKLRTQFREQQKWEEADAIRHCLQNAGISVEDGPDDTQWRGDK